MSVARNICHRAPGKPSPEVCTSMFTALDTSRWSLVDPTPPTSLVAEYSLGPGKHERSKEYWEGINLTDVWHGWPRTERIRVMRYNVDDSVLTGVGRHRNRVHERLAEWLQQVSERLGWGPILHRCERSDTYRADTVGAYLELYHRTPLFFAPHEFRKKVLHGDFLWNQCATVDHERILLPV